MVSALIGAASGGASAYDEDHTELAQQFTSEEAYTAYIVAQIKQSNIDQTITTPPVNGNPDETEEEVRPRKEKRIKGRKRAANPHAPVECALRRQQELRSSFRTLARPLKFLLEEMARRTTEQLETNDSSHRTASEHEGVTAGLQTAFDNRIRKVKKADELARRHLDSRKQAQEQLLRASYNQTIEDTYDQMLDTMDRDILRIDRRMRRQQGDGGHDTEEEADDTLPVPHRTSYRFDRHEALPSGSRSRISLDTHRASEHMDERERMRDLLQDHASNDAESFTVMDASVRDAAEARRQGAKNVEMLVQATKHVDSEEKKQKRRRQLSKASNADATSLMALADVATGNSISPSIKRQRRSNDLPATPIRSRQLDDHVFKERSSTGDSIPTWRKRRISHGFASSPPQLHSKPSKIMTSPTKQGVDYTASKPVKAEQSSILSPVQFEPRADSRRASDHFDAERRWTDHGSEFHYPHLLSGPSGNTIPDYAEPHRNERRPSTGGYGAFSSALDSPYRPAFANPRGYGPVPPPKSIMNELGSHFESHSQPLPRRPPMLPTAQPINHFAKEGIHRNGSSSFAPLPPPPVPWATSASPLVAIPQSTATPGSSANSLLGMPPPSSGYTQSILHPVPPPPPPAPSMSQYGGPMLAPAAGNHATPKPAFAQQQGRQEQNRRRNTEGSWPKFRLYHGPDHK